MDRLTVRFNHSNTVHDKRPYTIYEIEVRSSSTVTWVIWKRFSHFAVLHTSLLKLQDALAHEYHHAVEENNNNSSSAAIMQAPPRIPVLPAKRFTRLLAPDFVEKRKQELQAYLRAVLLIPGILNHPVLLDFLDVPDTVRPMLRGSSRLGLRIRHHQFRDDATTQHGALSPRHAGGPGAMDNVLNGGDHGGGGALANDVESIDSGVLGSLYSGFDLKDVSADAKAALLRSTVTFNQYSFEERRVVELVSLLRHHPNRVAAIRKFEKVFFDQRPRYSNEMIEMLLHGMEKQRPGVSDVTAVENISGAGASAKQLQQRQTGAGSGAATSSGGSSRKSSSKGSGVTAAHSSMAQSAGAQHTNQRSNRTSGDRGGGGLIRACGWFDYSRVAAAAALRLLQRLLDKEANKDSQLFLDIFCQSSTELLRHMKLHRHISVDSEQRTDAFSVIHLLLTYTARKGPQLTLHDVVQDAWSRNEYKMWVSRKNQRHAVMRKNRTDRRYAQAIKLQDLDPETVSLKTCYEVVELVRDHENWHMVPSMLPAFSPVLSAKTGNGSFGNASKNSDLGLRCDVTECMRRVHAIYDLQERQEQRGHVGTTDSVKPVVIQYKKGNEIGITVVKVSAQMRHSAPEVAGMLTNLEMRALWDLRFHSGGIIEKIGGKDGFMDVSHEVYRADSSPYRQKDWILLRSSYALPLVDSRASASSPTQNSNSGDSISPSGVQRQRNSTKTVPTPIIISTDGKQAVSVDRTVIPDTATIVLPRVSVTHGLAPEVEIYARAVMLPTGYALTPLPDDPSGCLLTFVAQFDELGILTITPDLLGETDDLRESVRNVDRVLSMDKDLLEQAPRPPPSDLSLAAQKETEKEREFSTNAVLGVPGGVAASGKSPSRPRIMSVAASSALPRFHSRAGPQTAQMTRWASTSATTRQQSREQIPQSTGALQKAQSAGGKTTSSDA